MTKVLGTIGKAVSKGKDNLDEYAKAIEEILQMHDGVEVIRLDGTIVRLK